MITEEGCSFRGRTGIVLHSEKSGRLRRRFKFMVSLQPEVVFVSQVKKQPKHKKG